jgi:hypothetical protein
LLRSASSSPWNMRVHTSQVSSLPLLQIRTASPRLSKGHF